MNSSEYLSEVCRIIRENFRSSDSTGGMPAAAAALLVKRTLGRDQTEFGFYKFKNALNALEERGLVRTGNNSKGAFSVWLTDASSTSSVQKDLPNAKVQDRFRPLRDEVWFAFVSGAPAGPRYLNRITGEVRVGVTERPLPNEEWVEIQPIEPNAEREVARQWIKGKVNDDAELVGSIEGPQWYVEFPKLIFARDPALAVAWKRDRSRRVIEIVKNWCQQNDLDQELVFAKLTRVVPSGESKLRGPARSQIKGLLLIVLERMSVEELLRLNLPARQLVAVLRPELLD
ncbi:MAG TPA: hypothetical protein VGY55_09605 [Pirellulales bacterium]|jgi:hypothetical protein|nr:hypothetical protein [Pirellulales bacterium]